MRTGPRQTGLLETYSQRSAQRDTAIDEFTNKNGRKPTDNEVAVLVRESCADKLAEIPTEQVRQQQRARLSPEESYSLERLRDGSLEHGRDIPYELSRVADSLQYAKEHLFERGPTFGSFATTRQTQGVNGNGKV